MRTWKTVVAAGRGVEDERTELTMANQMACRAVLKFLGDS